MDSELFRVYLARRLRVTFLGAAGPCPNACLDVFLDHALVSKPGGDRALRRSAAQNTFHTQACASRLRAEKEKPGLLPPQSDDEGPIHERLSHGRRPADVWVVGWDGRGAAAIDFAVTSGLRGPHR